MPLCRLSGSAFREFSENSHRLLGKRTSLKYLQLLASLLNKQVDPQNPEQLKSRYNRGKSDADQTYSKSALKH